MVAKLKPILPKKYTHDPKLLMVAIEETIDDAEKQFARTYRTFSDDHKPKFDKNFNMSEKQIYGSVTTSGEGSSDNPYPFLEKGTPVRYARMTPNFVSKTQPGVLNSRKGRGGFLKMGKPLPGIKPRNWEAMVEKIQKPRFNSRLNKAMGRYQKKTGHSI